MTDDYDPLHDLHTSQSEKIAYAKGRRNFKRDWTKAEKEYGIIETDCSEVFEALDELRRVHAREMREMLALDPEKYSESGELLELERGWQDLFYEKLKDAQDRCCKEGETKQETTEESKSDKFRRLVGPRTETAVDKIKIIGNLASANYECTDSQANALVNKLESAVRKIKRKFKKRSRARISKGRRRRRTR